MFFAQIREEFRFSECRRVSVSFMSLDCILVI